MGNENPDERGEQDPYRTARATPSFANVDHTGQIDLARLRMYRLRRVQEQLRARDYAACLLYNPINLRYATGCRNMQVWTMHNEARYAFVPAQGKPVLFDYRNCEHLSEGLESVGEVRRSTAWYYFTAGSSLERRVAVWADEIADLMRSHGGDNLRLAVDKLDREGVHALESRGLVLFNGQVPLEHARSIKSPEEIACMGRSIAVCETALGRIREALEPGRSERELWSILTATNAELGGEYVETMLLSSGGRTNPWYNEASDRLVRSGELMAIDTDMIGPYGYDADLSRVFFCGPGRPTGQQRTLYRLAIEQVQHNLELLRPGLSFREFADRAWRVPDRYRAQAVASTIHGVGMCNEYPQIGPADDFERWGYDGHFEADMTVCVESYIGETGGSEGVKLEQMVLLTEQGNQLLSAFPFDDDLLG